MVFLRTHTLLENVIYLDINKTGSQIICCFLVFISRIRVFLVNNPCSEILNHYICETFPILKIALAVAFIGDAAATNTSYMCDVSH